MTQGENNNSKPLDYRFIDFTFILPGLLVTTIIGFIFFIIIPIIELWGQKVPNLALSILLIMLGLGTTCFFVASPIYLIKKRNKSLGEKRGLGLSIIAIILANALPVSLLALSIGKEYKEPKAKPKSMEKRIQK